MAWYWWVLIVAGTAAFILVKVKVSGSFMKSMKKRQDEKVKRAEEDE